MKVLFDPIDQMYLHNGWRRFAVEVRHFIFSKFDGNGVLTVKVFTTTPMRMTRRGQDEDTRVPYHVFINF
jgi:hypothetical protein